MCQEELVIYSLSGALHSSRNFFCQVFVSYWAFSLLGKNISELAQALEATRFPIATLPPAVGNKAGDFSKEILCGGPRGFQVFYLVKRNGFILQGTSPAVLNKQNQERGRGRQKRGLKGSVWGGGGEKQSMLRGAMTPKLWVCSATVKER